MKLKELFEQRAKKQAELKAMLDKCTEEQRTISADEKESFDKIVEEIRAIDDTIKAINETRELGKLEETAEEEKKEQEMSVEQRDIEAFDAFLRDTVEERQSVQLSKSANGAVIPTSIANKIIAKVVDMCPIYADAEKYNVGGTLTIPYYDENTSKITMSYADEGTDGESTSGKFTSISLTGYLARAITEVSKSLVNNSQFDLVSFVVNKMAQAIALFIEGELLNGTTNKIDGLKGVTKVVTAAATTAVTADEIIDLQESIPDQYQANAYFIMNKATRTAIRKLKDGQGNYLLNKDANSRWGYTLFGKDVYTSDNVDTMAAGKTAIFYGDMTGLAVKLTENIDIEVLRETKARQHLIEIVGFVELDAKVQDVQKIAKLVMKAS